MSRMKLRAGDWVEVRSKEEILRTLDRNGRLQELPFMPEMFQYCGRRYRVFKRAHKTCDTVNRTGGRWLPDGIHLDLRCDGQAHGGCQAGCLIFWKEAWLKPIDEERGSAAPAARDEPRKGGAAVGEPPCTEENVRNATRVPDRQSGGEVAYVCQATHLPSFTTHVAWWDVRQYAEDYTSGNASLGKLLRGFIYCCYYYGALANRDRLARPAWWLYDRIQALWGGVPFPRRRGIIPVGDPTPVNNLNLQPGELVRVKSHKDILATIDRKFYNRGLIFDAELVPYCGQTYRVKTRISKFIDENTGKMRTLKTPAIILEGVYCQSRYSNLRMFCPRSIYSWWREIWLERVSDASAAEQPVAKT